MIFKNDLWTGDVDSTASYSAARSAESTRIIVQAALSPTTAARAFWVFLLLHFAVWSLLPILFHPNAPLDVVEAVSWGREWRLGYYKHPALSFWFANLAYLACGGRLWGIFVLSQLSIATGLWAVWKVAREVLDDYRALASCFLLEGIIYFNFTSPEFNPNVLELAIWPLIVFFGWRTLGQQAETESSLWNWFGLGACAGLGLFTKYYTAMLLISLLLFAFTDVDARRVWRRAGPYISMVTAMAVVSPHVWWALSTRLATVNYAMARATAHQTQLTRFTAPLKFTGAQLLAVLPMLVASLILFGWWKPLAGFRGSLKARLLMSAVLGPFFLTLLLSFIFNWKLLSMWGTPLWSFLPLLLLWSSDSSRYVDNLKLRGCRLERLAGAAVLLTMLLGVAFIFPLTAGPYVHKKPRKALFGGEQLANQITQRWRARTGTSLAVVAGDTWLAGNVAFYAPERPSVLTDCNLGLSPWISENEVRILGAALIWQGTQPAAECYKIFPRMEVQQPVQVAWHTRADVQNTPVYWAIVAPLR